MPRLKYKKKGKRVNLWIPAEQMKMASEIDNLSAFLQLSLRNAIDIMVWDTLKKKDPQKYHINHKESDEEIIEAYNINNPVDPLTAKRLKKETWHKPSQNLPEILL